MATDFSHRRRAVSDMTFHAFYHRPSARAQRAFRSSLATAESLSDRVIA